MKPFISKYIYILAILSIFTLFVTLFIAKLNLYGNFIPDWDEGHHLSMAFYYHRGITEYSWPTLRDVFFNSHQIYPPMYHILTSLSYMLFGLSSNAGVITNVPFILILMLSVYGIGLTLGDKKAGLLAAILVPILPVFLSLQERATIDYLSISMFIASFYLLFKTNYFTNSKYSTLFAISILIGLLIKWPFIVPSIPFAFYAIYGLLTRKSERGLIIKNLLLITFISSISLLWYASNLKYILSDLNFYWGASSYPQLIWNFPRGLSIDNITLYLYTYPISASGVGVLTLLSFYISIYSVKKTDKIKYLLSSVLITYLILTFTRDKSAYYIAYCYPILTLISSMAIFEIKSIRRRNIFLLLMVTPIIINFTFTQKRNVPYKQYFINFYEDRLLVFPNYFTKFDEERWPTKDIVDMHLNNKNCPRGVLFFPDNRYLNFSDIRYYLLINNAEIASAPAHRYYNPAIDKTYSIDILQKYSCIVTKTGDAGSFSSVEVVNWVNKYLSSNKEYNLITFNAPDETTISLYIQR